MVKYQVFVNSVHGSDVIEYDNRDDAIKEAKKWSKDCPNEEVIVLRVKEEEDVAVINGQVIDKSCDKKIKFNGEEPKA